MPARWSRTCYYFNSVLSTTATASAVLLNRRIATELFNVVSALPQTQIVPQRWKARFIVRRKRKRPIQGWFDPADKSWAEPILEQNKRKATEPPPEASMLHMVYRIRDHFTRPYWEKNVLKEFDLFDKTYNPVVLKNTPEVNEKLKMIQHLVRIKPVTFPYGLPQDEGDYKHCYLRENGEFVVKHKLGTDDAEKDEQAWEEVKIAKDRSHVDNIWKMDVDTIRKQGRRVLQNYKLSEEYFREKYVYRHNQDGKEDRYKGNHNIGNKRQDWH